MTQAASSRRILCFGEMLLRFSPDANELLMQSPALTVRPAGAEANVAVSLARFGAPTGIATVLADNALGRGVRDEVRKHGVDTSQVVFKPGRMGLYFLTPGAVRRPSEVLYDRAGSAFVEYVDTAFDWDQLLDGVEWLHASGVTPATGPNGSAAALAIIEAAVRKGVNVSYDGNFRGKLWEQWDGDPPATLGKMLAGATVAFADDRDFALVLKTTFISPDPAVRRREAAKAAFAAFPRLQRIACTLRVQDSVADQALSAVMLTRNGGEVIETKAEAIHMAGVVDRVGGGDAFASGVLFGLWNGWSDQVTLDFGLAAAGLKHSVPGDFNLFTADDVRAAMGDGGFDIRR
ncbi:2-keto-3-deoxygluconate kinase [Brevundimonas sp. GW460-12-10-14-LB2]|uniref:sugar kinase n=1 Tax=Brevundimonas sp. GW460-12-10-14-LB2 TaxID=1827469 RepID=UPI0007BCA2D8|nr:sugar kinase [Brevundimonas sp. GW460-12-10-14-LB2]ANC53549.1 2-keto-3-deoxygluconate kinase [Brevundimonas sp. GW460-12-10-14-LB2]